jgi:DNA repair exonuclease SbcCD ATPase subunit
MEIADMINMIIGVVALLSVIVGIAWVMLRQIAAGGDAKLLKQDLDALLNSTSGITGTLNAIQERHLQLSQKLSDVEAKLYAGDARHLANEESIRSLGNKLSSRNRTLKKIEQEEQERAQAEAEAEAEISEFENQIPGTEQIEMFQPDDGINTSIHLPY